MWLFLHPALADTLTFASQVVGAQDNAGQPFAVIDKINAKLTLFNSYGAPVQSTPILLGAAVGDQSLPGVGSKAISAVEPHERTTPAGRFISELGRNANGELVIWIDYDAAISMHRLRPSKPSEKRPSRMASVTPKDNRITYGCINIPSVFFDQWMLPHFNGGRVLVYVLPEVKHPSKLFKFIS
jgi:hypothetical protein